MSTTLYLVRHGKASDDQSNYDWLSPIGEEQMERLGRDLLARRLPEVVWQGRHRRHTASVAILRRVWATVGHTVADPEQLAAFDEFDTTAFRGYIKRRAAEPGAPRGHAPLFVEAVDLWAHGRLADEPEPFAHFLDRSIAAVERVAARGGTQLCLMSGGPLAAVLAGLAPEPHVVFAEMLERTLTASLTELVYDGPRARPRLVRQGDVSHLPEPLRILV